MSFALKSMIPDVTSSYGPDWFKESMQDEQFILSDIADELEEAMRDTTPEDWNGVEE